MGIKYTILSIAVLVLAACGNTKHVEEKNTVAESPSSETYSIWVNSYMGNCGTMSPESPFLLTQQTEKLEGKNWKCLYKEIQGFNYENGYICHLTVKNVMNQGLPGLELVNIVSKERDVEYFRLYDIWALTHINEEVLEVTATRPNMEINLNTMKVMGKGMCNQYFGKITAYNTSTIQFGPIAGTKMMCPEIDQEQAFLAALAATRSYAIRSMTLGFYDENMKELLRFQKVD